MNVVESVEAGEIARLTEGRIIPAFSAGDTVRVNVKVVEGTRERVQAFEGVGEDGLCLSRLHLGRGPPAGVADRRQRQDEDHRGADRPDEGELAELGVPGGQRIVDRDGNGGDERK